MIESRQAAFPRRPDNRPALPRVSYRIGAYPDVRDAIWRALNRAPELADWTHRVPDDPGAALVEVAAVIADVLTFYQEHYANETWLRTARWEESVRELVRLTGYRLAPPTGGRTRFAFTVRGNDPITVPKAFPIQAELETADEPIDFLTSESIVAEPALSAFNLYRSRTINHGLTAGSTTFEIARVGDSQDPDRRAKLELNAGDQIMIIPNEPPWVLGSGSIGTNLTRPQVVKVKSVARTLDRLTVEVENPIREPRFGTVRAYRIGRTFRHFGHNAPDVHHRSIKSGSRVTGTREFNTKFGRHWNHTCTLFTSSKGLDPEVIPLDQEVGDLLAGSTALIEVPVSYGGTDRDLVVARQIERISAGPMDIGDMSGSATFVTLKEVVTANTSGGLPRSDLRDVRFHETTSPELQLRRATTHPGGPFTDTDQLFYFGTAAEAVRLLNRTIILQAADRRSAIATVVSVDTGGMAWKQMRRVTLNEIPEGFSRDDFDEEAPLVTVFGNVAESTQGRLEPVAVLGNGDMRQAFQSFKLPKAPLTYLHDHSATPPVQPELIVRVNGREWTRVDSLFAREPKEMIYIVRPDDAGDSWVQFGDGTTGARLPSGIKNVTAEYRTGNGALGPVKEKSNPTGGARLDGLDEIVLPREVTAGSDGESIENARINAPARLQSLNRMVGLADYESEARSIPGVVTARAAWDIADGTPAIAVRMLLGPTRQSDEQFDAAAEMLRKADRTRGINRYPIAAVQCALRFVYLTVECAFDSALRWEDVKATVRAALGPADEPEYARDGLFGLHRRDLGQAEHRLTVEGRVQNTAGVRWCRVVHFGILVPSDDPESLPLPTHRMNQARIPCTPVELLQLHSRHLVINPIQP